MEVYVILKTARRALVVACLLATGAALQPAAATAAPAPVPCTAIGEGRYNCEWYRPGDGITGGSIVQLGGRTVGYLHQGTNWIVCQQKGARVHNREGDLNEWYGWTLSDGDPGAWGWASPLDARGGDDYGQFAGVPDCNGAHGPAPSTPGLWGGGDAAPTPPQGTPAPPATAANYRAALDRGFGATPAGSQRVVLDSGVTTGDDGVIVTKFFIPNARAAAGMLRGDERNWSSDPATADRSRFYLTWDVATGKVSVTITQSTEPDGDAIPALRIDRKGRCSEVRSTDLAARDTNEVWVGRDGDALEVCFSALNSLTNRLPLPGALEGAGAWSVDGMLSLTPHSAGKATARASSPRAVGRPSARAAQHGISPRVADLARQVRRCTTQRKATRRCRQLRHRLRAGARRIERSAHWRRGDVRRAWRRTGACRRSRGDSLRRGAPSGRCPVRQFGQPLAGGYDIALHGNGYPAIESYYYPRTVNTAHTLFLRRVDPAGLGWIGDRGGGLGALDLASYWWCFSGKGGDDPLKSACAFDLDSANEKRQGDVYYTRLGDAAG
jgi:hypothetical protein